MKKWKLIKAMVNGRIADYVETAIENMLEGEPDTVTNAAIFRLSVEDYWKLLEIVEWEFRKDEDLGKCAICDEDIRSDQVLDMKEDEVAHAECTGRIHKYFLKDVDCPTYEDLRELVEEIGTPICQVCDQEEAVGMTDWEKWGHSEWNELLCENCWDIEQQKQKQHHWVVPEFRRNE